MPRNVNITSDVAVNLGPVRERKKIEGDGPLEMCL